MEDVDRAHKSIFPGRPPRRNSVTLGGPTSGADGVTGGAGSMRGLRLPTFYGLACGLRGRGALNLRGAPPCFLTIQGGHPLGDGQRVGISP